MRTATRPESPVTAGHSTLLIPCGCGYTVPTDWYFPSGGEPPKGMIWLQHGFFEFVPLFDGLATDLAESTDSIVVAPTVTSNFLECDDDRQDFDVIEEAKAVDALVAECGKADGRTPPGWPPRVVDAIEVDSPIGPAEANAVDALLKSLTDG